MSEGKPGPAGDADKWTPEVRDGAGAQGLPDTPENRPSDGDLELERPATVGSRGAGADGDFELERPAAMASAGARDEGDFELERPAAPLSVGAEGDFELERPRAVSAGAAEHEGSSEGEGSVPREDGAAHGVPDGRSRPFPDPDPYDTPPYGIPGPWAPAPPVQHPAAAPPSLTKGTLPPQSAPPAPGAPLPATPGNDTSAPPASASQATAPPAPGAGYTPWQNYDPWAPQPFRQDGAGVTTPRSRRRRLRRGLVLGAVAIALVSGAVGGVVGVALERDGDLVGDVRLPQAGKEPAGRAPDSVAGIAARALPSVVTLHVKGDGNEDTGTGFVLDARGHILTNNHVVQPAGANGEISVTFNGGETAKGTVVGRDTGYDLAVVQVTGVRGLTPLPLGNSDNVEVGDPVVAIGAPFDLAGTVTSGIISAKERPITAGGEKGDGSDVSYVDALQTDAPINPGNSGGPLLDSRGRVVGINSAIRSADDSTDQSGQAGSIGLGFAIPVNQARRVAEELINTGRATHPVIGVTLDMNFAGDGARVAAKGADGGPAVTKGGPGDRAGVRPGDVITQVDGARVHSGEEMIVRTRAHRPGDRLALTVVRDGRQRSITLVLGSAGGS
ncbi:S1C family serine protease [Streptomyces gibsoniae]|uniref:Trypsin-like peptidase domain-containing protein n=1 Tax=Streptomyces gibsoniae TaxID=3075529 RepID=A0ABU2TPG5_9ACTN|nr:trypsin-like peptidase domain-containing protein [Streptomyces sp. DSM 41699]MDT0462792.1 trypsin-like peptidase domain-containing protein [Streptomyces sp. DSM 41699]